MVLGNQWAGADGALIGPGFANVDDHREANLVDSSLVESVTNRSRHKVTVATSDSVARSVCQARLGCQGRRGLTLYIVYARVSFV